MRNTTGAVGVCGRLSHRDGPMPVDPGHRVACSTGATMIPKARSSVDCLHPSSQRTSHNRNGPGGVKNEISNEAAKTLSAIGFALKAAQAALDSPAPAAIRRRSSSPDDSRRSIGGRDHWRCSSPRRGAGSSPGALTEKGSLAALSVASTNASRSTTCCSASSSSSLDELSRSSSSVKSDTDAASSNDAVEGVGTTSAEVPASLPKADSWPTTEFNKRRGQVRSPGAPTTKMRQGSTTTLGSLGSSSYGLARCGPSLHTTRSVAASDSGTDSLLLSCRPLDAGHLLSCRRSGPEGYRRGENSNSSRRTSSLAVARMSHKENVAAEARTARFNNNIIEKLSGLQESLQ